MNKILIGVNALLVAAVLLLFVKVNGIANHEKSEEAEESHKSEIGGQQGGKNEPVKEVGNIPTGKIAYVNIDRLNEESLEIIDLVAEAKRRKNNLEASVESLSMQYQQKIEEYQNSAKAGIAPPSEMQAKEREIMQIEKEAQNKQLQMDNLTMDISEKNAKFQKNVHDYLVKWNKGEYDFIFSYSEAVPTLLLGNSTLEITDEVITGLNKEYKESKGKKK